jgi:hypothetical protein
MRLVLLALALVACAPDPVAVNRPPVDPALRGAPTHRTALAEVDHLERRVDVLAASFVPVLAQAPALAPAAEPAATDPTTGELVAGIGAAFQAKNWPLLATLVGLLALLAARAAAWSWPFIPQAVSDFLHTARGTVVAGSVIGFLGSLATAAAVVGHVDWGAVGTSLWSTLGAVVLALLRDAAPSSAKVAAGK